MAGIRPPVGWNHILKMSDLCWMAPQYEPVLCVMIIKQESN
jgi:hypothetical protein